jgi:hypothetical protein
MQEVNIPIVEGKYNVVFPDKYLLNNLGQAYTGCHDAARFSC